MDRFDALIVGGGPGGASCAWRLQQAGLKVAVVDRSTFPRDKVCAGWITPAVLQTLAIAPEEYAAHGVLQPITGFRTGLLGGREASVDYDSPVSYGIRRREFDHYLLQRSGARLHLGQPVQLERAGTEWVVNGTLRAPLLIGAGGHFCPVARHLGARPGQGEQPVTAQEVEFALSDAEKARCTAEKSRPELYFCRDLRGYGWVFRKGDFLNIGLGREGSRNLSGHVQEFCRFLEQERGLGIRVPEKLQGHAYLLFRQVQPRRIVDDGVLLIGDAAGLAYPQSGEGIRPAIESGLLAAETLLAAEGDYRRERLADYQARLNQRFGPRQGGGTLPLPERLKGALAALLLGNRHFARHVVLDRWFLHRHQSPLAGAS